MGQFNCCPEISASPEHDQQTQHDRVSTEQNLAVFVNSIPVKYLKMQVEFLLQALAKTPLGESATKVKSVAENYLKIWIKKCGLVAIEHIQFDEQLSECQTAEKMNQLDRIQQAQIGAVMDRVLAEEVEL